MVCVSLHENEYFKNRFFAARSKMLCFHQNFDQIHWIILFRINDVESSIEMVIFSEFSNYFPKRIRKTMQNNDRITEKMRKFASFWCVSQSRITPEDIYREWNSFSRNCHFDLDRSMFFRKFGSALHDLFGNQVKFRSKQDSSIWFLEFKYPIMMDCTFE
jgi:hypothetical protein